MNSITDCVQFPPVPAMIGTLWFAVFTANSIVCFLSSSVIVELSPVVPQTISASTPSLIWNSISFSNSLKFTPFSSNGVTMAVPQPLNIIFFM